MDNMRTILVTGGCGFVGSNFIRMTIQDYPDVHVVNLDALTEAGNLDNVTSFMDSPQYTFVPGNIRNENLVKKVISDFHIDTIVNFAAETNVYYSFEKPKAYAETNISGTLNLFQQAARAKIKRFLQISTDKVYGVCNENNLPVEESEIKPSSPYAASKAFADYFIQNFPVNFDLETVIVRCCSSYGPNQFPSKFIPMAFIRAKEKRSISVYGRGSYSRHWLHVFDQCSAIWMALTKGQAGEIYNTGGIKKTNLEIASRVLEYLGKTKDLITFAQAPSTHGSSHGANSRKIMNQLGWKPSMNFDDGFIKTLGWYYNNEEWLNRVSSGEYLNLYNHYYKKEG